MTWMYKRDDVLFPRTSQDIENELSGFYAIRNREYIIKNVAEGRDVVMVEMIESYKDPDTKETYRTPLVIVLEMRHGKILRGRHYCDPDISFLHLTKQQVEIPYK